MNTRVLAKSPSTHLMAPSQLVQRTAAFVKQQLKPNDASHDWGHIERVWTLAKSLAKEEARTIGPVLRFLAPAHLLPPSLFCMQRVSEENLEIVDLAALLHDIDDWKYLNDPEKPTKRAAAFLQSENVPSDKIACVMAIIDRMGFKEEVAGENKVRTCCSPGMAICPRPSRLTCEGVNF